MEGISGVVGLTSMGVTAREQTWQAAVLLAEVFDNSRGLVELASNEKGVLSMDRIEALHSSQSLKIELQGTLLGGKAVTAHLAVKEPHNRFVLHMRVTLWVS